MIYIENNSKNPYFNLALEEYLMKNYPNDDDILLLWQNDNTIVIGRNQNAYEEINVKQVKADNVKVVRRLSGGGTVYHDEGNLNFSFIKKRSSNVVNNYYHFLQPIISVLQKLGIYAEFSGKNDILITGKKISGNAQYANSNKILHHGTVLFNVDLLKLGAYLNVDPLKMQSKAIKSVQARVTNILPLLKDKITIMEFKALIITELLKGKNKKVILSSEQLEEINKLAIAKYASWEWNYGIAPKFQIQNKKLYEHKGTVTVGLNVNAGIITDIKISGDFMGYYGTEIIEQQLVGCKYDYEHIAGQLQNINIEEIFGVNFIASEIIDLII